MNFLHLFNLIESKSEVNNNINLRRMKMRNLSLFGLILSCVWLVGITVNAGMITESVVASDGAYVDEQNSGSEFPDSSLWIRNLREDAGRKSYARFSLADLPGDMTVDAATLKVREMSTDSNGSFQVNIYGIVDNNDWDGSNITWNNAPKNDTDAYTSEVAIESDGTELLGSYTGSAGDDVPDIDLDVADYVAWARGENDSFGDDGGDTNDDITFILTLNSHKYSSSATSARYQGTEENNPPTLDVTMVPEPGTLALLSIGGTLLLAGRRRRR